MSKPKVLLAAILLVSVPLAGCLDRDDAPATTPDAPGEGGDAGGLSPEEQARLNVTDDGSRADNESLGHMPHLHDYWRGKERVTLMEEDVEVDTFSGTFWTFFNVFARRTAAAGGAYVNLPDGATVFEGTGKLELTATWEDPKVTGMAVRYRSAASPDFGEPIPLTAGTTLVVDVTPDMTDMPHMSSSKWAFIFEPSGNGQAVMGTFRVKVDIVKVGDIMLFPGHPELFEGKHEKVILDADGRTAQQNFASRIAGFMTAGAGAEQETGLPAEEVVPMETQEMRVDLKINSATTTVGQASEVYLLYKSAETNRWRLAEHISGDVSSNTFVFAIPVDMSMVDSPYAKESQWRFDVRVASELVDGTGFECGGCTDAQIDYHVTVTAFDSPQLLNGTVSEEEPDDDRRADAPAAAAGLPSGPLARIQ